MQRSNEFLQLALTSPAVQQITGMEGLAELLRPMVRRLDINPDKVVPSLPVLRQRMAEQLQFNMMNGGANVDTTGQQPKPSREQLQDGSPTTDQFAPRRQ